MKPIRSVMTSSPVTIAPDTNVADALKLMEAHGVRHLPVTEEGRTVGLFSIREAMKRPGHMRALVPVRKMMRTAPYTTGPDTPLSEVLLEMATRRIGSVVIVGEAGEPLGIFTTVDALKALARSTR